MRVAFIGPVGAGKTTQAQRLARALPHYNPRLSSGEIVRAHVEAGTELGRRMEEYYDRGEAVPDGLLQPLILDRVRREHGWVLDNFPASVAQAEALDAELRGREAGHVSRVIALEGHTEEALGRRLEARRGEYAALKERYEARGLLSVVDARRPIAEVASDVLEALGHPERQEFYALGR